MMSRVKRARRVAVTTAAALSLVGAGAALAQAAADVQSADGNLLTLKDSLVLHRLYTGPDERSHVEIIQLNPRGYNEGRRWIEASATRMTVGAMPHGLVGDYHPAMRRTVLMPMQGTLVIDVGDGKTYRLRPGQMVLAEDRTGKGHISTCDSPGRTGQCLFMMVNLKDGEEGLQALSSLPPAPPNYSDPNRA